MTDQELADRWGTLDPADAERRRIDVRVSDWIEAHDTSIVAEWIGLVRVAPVSTLTLTTVSGLAIVLASPLPWLVRTLADALP